MKNKNGNVVVVAIIIVVVAISAGVVGWILAKKSQVVTQQNPPAKTVQQPAQLTQPVSESAEPSFDKSTLQNTVVSTVDNTLKAKYNATKDPGYATWDKKVDITSVDVSLKAAKGEWWASDAWPWISWQQDDGSWKVLLSFDGFNCKELNSIPSQYATFFKDVTFQFGRKNCY